VSGTDTTVEQILTTYDTITVVGASTVAAKAAHSVPAHMQRHGWRIIPVNPHADRILSEPVYRTLRELVMSYFESFYNVERQKTLHSYTRPLNLAAFDKDDWMRSDEHLEAIANRLDEVRAFRVVTPPMVAGLSPVDARSYKAGLLGANPAGLWRPS